MNAVKRTVFLGLALLTLIGMGSVTATANTPAGIIIFSPQNGAVYLLNQPVTVSWVVIDPGPSSGIKSIFTTADDGSLLDTSTVGWKRFIVVVVDTAGNKAAREADYWIAYRAQAIEPTPQSDFVPAKVPQLVAKVGQTIPFSFTIKDFFDVTAPNAVGTLSVFDTKTQAIVAISKDIIGIFRYDNQARLYRSQLDTSALKPGNYEVIVQFDDGLTIYRYLLTVSASS
jgi:hypothetical protein